MKISIISLFYNRSEISRQYLEYWKQNIGFFRQVELIFGDSASTDDTRALLNGYKEIARIHHFESNPGFAAGNNHLASLATGEVLIFLNNDTLPSDGWLMELKHVLQARPDVGIVGNVQLSVASRQVDHAGVFFDKDGTPLHFRPPLGALDKIRWMPVPAVTGACMAVRASLFRELKGFDTRYINGYEDTDFCLRARAHTADILVATRSHIWHYVRTPQEQLVLEARSAALFSSTWKAFTLELSVWRVPQLEAPATAVSLKHLPRANTLQVFFPCKESYAERCSQRLLHETDRWCELRIPLPVKELRRDLPLRLDPAQAACEVQLRKFVWSNADGSTRIEVPDEALASSLSLGGTAELQRSRGSWLIKSTGEDPQLYIAMPESLCANEAEVVLSFQIRIKPAPLMHPPAEPRLMPRPVPVLVDLYQLHPGGENGGVKVLAYEILRSLIEDPSGSFTVTSLIHPDLEEELKQKLPKHPFITIPLSDYKPGAADWLKPFDVVYAPVGFSPLKAPSLRHIGTVVDLLHRDMPSFLPRQEVYTRETSLLETLVKSEAIQCNSRFVIDRLRHHYGAGEHRLFIVYNVLQHRLTPDLGPPPQAHKTPYFLYPANFWRHKNHSRLLEAYAQYRTRVSQPWDLVLTGTGLIPNSGIHAQDGVRWVGYVPDRDYANLLTNAGGLVFPSLYEGFGIPPFEALCFGVPVACSNVASLPEIARHHATFFDPTKVDEICEAMIKLTAKPKSKGKLRPPRPEDWMGSWADQMAKLTRVLTS